MSDRPDPPAPRPLGSLRLWLLVALVVAFAGLRAQPPAPAPVDASATEFSAARAMAVLERIVGDPSPHGVGTPANAAVADRIEAELRALGLTVERQHAMSCRHIVCAPVVNLVADVPGTEPGGPVVLLTSHYDSVHAGPGVADDLHAVALSIEVARALLAGDRPAHSVRLLIDEGEERGLLGAKAFVEQHPRARETAVVVNAEARGTTGSSSLFQTSEGNGALMAEVLGELPRPSATSLTVEVYRRMPNDTDLTIFLEAGYAGLNFAFVGGVGRYHTPLDDLAHLDPGSVQHQGQSVLASVRALADGPLPLPTGDDAIYSDLLGLLVLRWPAAWATALPLALLGVLLGLLALARRRGRARLARTPLGVVGVLGLVLLTTGAALLLPLLVAAVQGQPTPAHAHPLPLRLALWLSAAGIAGALGSGLGRGARTLELAFGVAIAWGAATVALAAAVPGASAVLVIPVAAMGLGLAGALLWPRHEGLALAMGALPFVAMWTQLSLALEDAFGYALAPAVAVPMAVGLSAVLPGLVRPPGPARPWPPRILGLAIAAALVAACIVPVYDADAPRRVSLVHYDDRATGEAQVLAITTDGMAPPLAAALGPDARDTMPSWVDFRGLGIAGVPGTAPAPVLRVLSREPLPQGRRVRARLHSPRGADRAVLQVPPEALAAVTVSGQPVATTADPRGRLLLFGLPAEGVEIVLEPRGADPVELTVVDCVAGLPDSARAIAAARDADAIPVQWGDMACIGTRASL
ncbi:MAG: M28 family peptidase [Myxococcales bacterium]|nr:M28 family peptidase [Myxococcales bacterium]MCB9712853.1 M28 family peptidase [Myxococcales bacterium]